ncbi:hypothetical protein P872_12665 [Rhodonellum psychrophilum GCM71 = DSM 17998]|uniref:Uncharacterized protein n=1 Tax=Rhodonellum psychrophilum GCM71 = DSM 17998 TaxID=1123057 RepID=U5BJK4_9BACT|nr:MULTISPECIES: hypothetical protein [Rhodonellum]ERM80620.1 hypothetical protein P872_12665 [Rhodonellum psychrophilum GCM71 = DSM 17998]
MAAFQIGCALFFGEAGKYTVEQFTNRANMHGQIEAQINLMKQDFILLALELEKLKEYSGLYWDKKLHLE